MNKAFQNTGQMIPIKKLNYKVRKNAHSADSVFMAFVNRKEMTLRFCDVETFVKVCRELDASGLQLFE
jgi:hypothetical protein